MASAMPSWTGADSGATTGPGQFPWARPGRSGAYGASPTPRLPRDGEVSTDQADQPMTKAAKPAARIESLMDLASRALVETHYFEAERAAAEALDLAHSVHDYEAMARILLPLQEARRQNRLLATDAGKLTVVTEAWPENKKIKPGCYLFEPPMVGADAREFRDRATHDEVPVLVLAREPAVKSLKLDRRPGDWPVVMIGPVTVRAYVRPPKGDKPTLEWFQEACEALGDRAIASVDSGLDGASRVDDLLERLHTVVTHEKLHQALEAACRDAVAEGAKPRAKAAKAADQLEDDDL